jgi:hypothetical protein
LSRARVARRHLEEQPAGQRDADRQGNEESFDVGHQTRLLVSAAMPQSTNPQKRWVEMLRVLILE